MLIISHFYGLYAKNNDLLIISSFCRVSICVTPRLRFGLRKLSIELYSSSNGRETLFITFTMHISQHLQ